jgi:DNA-binding FadR family transcriptional regulator
MTKTQTVAKPAGLKRQHIADSLRELARTMAPGERLPAVGDLARRFGVPTSTIMVAIETLICEGVVVSRWPRLDTVDNHTDVQVRQALSLLSRPAPQEGIPPGGSRK